MPIGARPANPGGLAVGAVYLAIALVVLVVSRRDAGFVLGGSAAVTLALAGVVVVYLGWTRRTVRWTEERTRRRRVTVWVLLALAALSLVLWTVQVAVPRFG
ncbi:hypothetical protein [Solicola sp. PLA-1-18]|uniref:hypothetical protein n=1 Tax=Solicola sp. PLA-1-18 TaxID=3380532 RepID=UPI003B824EDD